jgi:hypothetical protein
MIGQRARSWWPLLAVTVLLVLAGSAAAVATPQLTRVPVPHSRQDDGPAPIYNGPTPVRRSPSESRTDRVARLSAPGWLLPLLGGLLLALVGAGLIIVLWRLARGRMRSRPAPPDEPAVKPMVAADEVVAAVDAGLSDLSDTDVDPRRAVIACWLRLEEVAAAAGTPRHPADTPTDLVTRLLAAHMDADPAVLGAFADIYRRARYATHSVDEQMRGQARTALERVRSALTGVRA